MAQTTSGAGQRSMVSTMAVVLAFVGTAVLAWFVFNQPAALDRSIIGTRGFVYFANAPKFTGKEKPVFHFKNDTRPVDMKSIGLRVLPLYDTNIFVNSAKPANIDDEFADLRPMRQPVFRRKIMRTNTLVVLPKWRHGALRTERLHPSFLISPNTIRLPFLVSNRLGAPEARQGEAGFSQAPIAIAPGFDAVDFSKLNTVAVTLYAPQTISKSSIGNNSCVPALLYGGATLLARCRWSSTVSFWLLTDPDILNNHGAGNGGNFEFTHSLMTILSGGGQVMIDATNTEPSTARKRDKRGRSFSDLARFFQYPFTAFWVALALLSIFTLWHSARRASAPRDHGFDRVLAASKSSSIDASVAMLRASSGTDGPLAARYVEQQLDLLAVDILGSTIRRGSKGRAQLLTSIARRNVSLADRLRALIETLMPNEVALGSGPGSSPGSNPGPGQGLHYLSTRGLKQSLNQFEITLKEVRHEFGRSSKTRR